MCVCVCACVCVRVRVSACVCVWGRVVFLKCGGRFLSRSYVAVNYSMQHKLNLEGENF